VSAELKMLRYLQERVNKSTKDFDAQPEGERVAATGLAASGALSQKQGRVHELMRRLAEKLGKENDTEGGR
jgi:hypothetical protein